MNDNRDKEIVALAEKMAKMIVGDISSPGNPNPVQRLALQLLALISPPKPKTALVDECGKFHCPCGATHSRGPINGSDVYRCLGCGTSYRVAGVAELRSDEQEPPKLERHPAFITKPRVSREPGGWRVRAYEEFSQDGTYLECVVGGYCTEAEAAAAWNSMILGIRSDERES